MPNNKNQINSTVNQILRATPVIPVIVIDNLEDAVPLAKALVAGGITVLEITLRSAVALDAIAEIIKHVPEAIVGAGTVVNVDQLEKVEALGVQFALSPGLTECLLKAANRMKLEYIPGIASASELMLGLQYHYQNFKLFPASVVGGIEMLNALGGPFPHVRFCPTGGITQENFTEYLALPNVSCVGGSWLLPKKLVQEKNWQAITDIAKATIKLSGG